MRDTTSDLAALWLWPWEAFRTMAATAEMLQDAQAVIGVRSPMILAALQNPWTADHRELRLMVSEKSDAFGKSARTLSNAASSLASAVRANARDLGTAASATVPDLMAWWRIGERNLRMAALFAGLSGAALAPISAGASANAKRLKRSPKPTGGRVGARRKPLG